MRHLSPTAALLAIALLTIGCDGAPEAPPAPTAAPPEAAASTPARKAKSKKELRVAPAQEDERPLSEAVTQGRAQLQAGDLDAAQATLDQAIHTHPDDADAWYWRGRVHRQADDKAGAKADIGQAVTLDPDFASARRQLAELYVLDNDCAHALPHLDRLVELRPDDASAHVNRGHCLLDAGDADGAIAEAQKACDLGHTRACRGVRHMNLRKNIETANLQAIADENAARHEAAEDQAAEDQTASDGNPPSDGTTASPPPAATDTPTP